MDGLKQCLMDLVTHFNTKTIIEVDINIFDDKTIYESVKLLKEIFKNKYPKTKLKLMMKTNDEKSRTSKFSTIRN